MTMEARHDGLGVRAIQAPRAPLVSAVLAGLSPARRVLANGATVIAKAAHITPAVTLHVSLQAGSVFDPPDLSGLAHFVSRTIDRGTHHRSADRLAEDLDSRGVSLAVSADRQVLSIVCTCLVEDFDAILDLVGEVVMAPAFTPAEVDTRRGEIITLIRQDEDNPAAIAGDRLMAALYGDGHPYGRGLRGTLDSVDRIDAGALRRFHAAHCVPGALSLAIVGDLEPQRAIDAAARVFEGWLPAPRPVVDHPPVVAATDRRVHVVPMMSKAQADIAYGFAAIRRSDPAYYASALMNNILGQYSIGGRLGDRIREREGMAYYVYSSLDANVLPGPLAIRVGVNPSNVERAVASIDEELIRLAVEGPTDRELAESKQYLIGSMPRMLETSIGIASFLQTVEFFGLGPDYDLRLPGLLRAVTHEDVHAAARRLLDPARATIVVAGPYDGALR